MRSGSLVDTPDNYVLDLAKTSRGFGPSNCSDFSGRTRGELNAENKPFLKKSQKNTDHIFSADLSNC